MRYGARVLRRAPRFAVAVVLILGLGVGMTTAVFAIVDSVLLNAVPFADAHRLVELNRFGPTGGGPSQPAAMVERWRNEGALFDGVEAYVRVERVFLGGREPETMQGARVSPGLLRLLGVAPALGRAFAPDEALSTVAIIGHATWMTRFGGDADIVGRPLRFKDGELTIVGVMPASFRFPDVHTDFWAPLDVGRRAASGDPGEGRVSVVARLGRDVTFEQADARAGALSTQWNPEWAATGFTTRLRSLNQLAGLGVDGQFAWVQQRRAALFLVFGLAACVLLIACANASNLFLSQALFRTREFAIRGVAGASRPRLCRQLLTESVLIAALAGLLGLAFARWLVGLAAATVPPEFGRGLLNPIDVDGRVAAWAAVAALFAGVAATLPPALLTVGRDLMRPIQDRGSHPASDHGRLRGGLVAVQSTLAVVLLIGALLMGRSLWTLLDVDVGWTADNAVALEPRLSGVRYAGTEARSRFLAQLADLTAAVPGVELAAPAEQVPFLPAMFSLGRLDADEANIAQAEVTINYVPNRYFAAAEIPILEGRGFDADAAPADAALVSRDLADRLWPPGTAVGQRFRMPRLAMLNDGDWLTVVGVAGSVHTNAFGIDFDRPGPVRDLPALDQPGRYVATAPVRAGPDGRRRRPHRAAQTAGVEARPGAAGHRARHGRRGRGHPGPAAFHHDAAGGVRLARGAPGRRRPVCGGGVRDECADTGDRREGRARRYPRRGDPARAGELVAAVCRRDRARSARRRCAGPVAGTPAVRHCADGSHDVRSCRRPAVRGGSRGRLAARPAGGGDRADDGPADGIAPPRNPSLPGRLGRMAELKTKQNDADVGAFLDGVENEKRREDCRAVVELMADVTGEPANWPDVEPIGRQFRPRFQPGAAPWIPVGRSDWFTVVGVVGRLPRESDRRASRPHRLSVAAPEPVPPHESGRRYAGGRDRA